MLNKHFSIVKLATILLIFSSNIATANSSWLVNEPKLPKKLLNKKDNEKILLVKLK